MVVIVLGLVVVVLFVVAGSSHAFGGHVVVALQASAELQAVAPEPQLLVAEGREGGLVGPRRERLRAGREEVPDLHLGAESSGDVLALPLIDQGPRDVGAVVEPRVDIVDAPYGVHVVVRHVDGGEGGAHALNELVVQVAQADVETADATLRGEVDSDVLRLPRLFVPVIVFLRVRVLPVRVEAVLEREAEAAVLERECAAREGPVAEVAEPGARTREIGRRVEDGTFRGVVVARPASAAAAPVEHLALRVLDVGICAGLAVRTPGVGSELRARSVGQRIAVVLGRGQQVAVGRVRGDDVDQSPDDAGAVQQRGRPPHDLDPLGAVRVDGHPVVIRRGGEVAGADPVLDDQHPVAPEAPDDRPARAGPEAAVGDARLVLEGFADGARRLPGYLERVDRGDRVERLQRRRGADRRRGDGDFLAHRRQAELEVGGYRFAGIDGDGLAAGGETLALGRDQVRADRHVRELERPVLGEREGARSEDQNHRAVDGTAVLRQRHRAAHRARLLRLARRCRHESHHGQDEQAGAPTRVARCAPRASGSGAAARVEVLAVDHCVEWNIEHARMIANNGAVRLCSHELPG